MYKTRIYTYVSVEGIRRPMLIDKDSGLPIEYACIYLFKMKGKSAYRTQLEILKAIGLLIDFCYIERCTKKRWIPIDERDLKRNGLLGEGDIDNLNYWVQRSLSELFRACELKSRFVYKARSQVVQGATASKRLVYIRDFLQWMTRQRLKPLIERGRLEYVDILRQRKEELSEIFDAKIQMKKSRSRTRSLDENNQEILATFLAEKNICDLNDLDMRDFLIIKVLLLTGLRPGELLKLAVSRVKKAAYSDRDNVKHPIGLLQIRRDSSSERDTRLDEPNVKGFARDVSISMALYLEIEDYIAGPRRSAVDRRGGVETPYLFVNHRHDKFVGKPLSQRSLNKIFEKQKVLLGGFDEFCPYTLRHTHLTQYVDEALKLGKGKEDINEQIRVRAGWSNNSNMHEIYTSRIIQAEAAKFIASRDKELGL